METYELIEFVNETNEWTNIVKIYTNEALLKF